MYGFVMSISLLAIFFGVIFVTLIDINSKTLKPNRARLINISYGILLILFVASIILYILTGVILFFSSIGMIGFIILLINLGYSIRSIKGNIKRKQWVELIDVILILFTQILFTVLLYSNKLDSNSDLIIDKLSQSSDLYLNVIAIFLGLGLYFVTLYVIGRIYLEGLLDKPIKRNMLFYFGSFSIGIFIGIIYFKFFDYSTINSELVSSVLAIVSIFELLLGSAIIPIILLLVSYKKNEKEIIVISRNIGVSNDIMSQISKELNDRTSVNKLLVWLSLNNINHSYSKEKSFHNIHIKNSKKAK